MYIWAKPLQKVITLQKLILTYMAISSPFKHSIGGSIRSDGAGVRWSSRVVPVGVVELGDSDSDTRDLMTGLFLDALRCAALPLRLRVPKSSS